MHEAPVRIFRRGCPSCGIEFGHLENCIRVPFKVLGGTTTGQY